MSKYSLIMNKEYCCTTLCIFVYLVVTRSYAKHTICAFSIYYQILYR